MTPSADKIRSHLLAVYDAAIRAVNGRLCVSRYLQQHRIKSPLYVIAIGKAAASMMQGAIDVLGSEIVSALVITKYGHDQLFNQSTIYCYQSGHPLPDQQSLQAGETLIEFINTMPASAPVLVLLSGGASSLVEKLPNGITLQQLVAVNQWLQGAGVDITVSNFIRKRLSTIKGGRLAVLLAPRPVTCLAISDVPNDDPAVIGSGPLSVNGPEPMLPVLPDFIETLLVSRAESIDQAGLGEIDYQIVANLADAKQAAAAAAQQLGYHVKLHQAFIAGDALKVGPQLVTQLYQGETATINIWGGETTVMLPQSPGRGGRAQSLALSAAGRMDNTRPAFLLAAGTDGTDGPGDDAGALVDCDTLARGEAAGFNSDRALDSADAGSFLEASGDLIQTGPTGTNVMDIMFGVYYQHQNLL